MENVPTCKCHGESVWTCASKMGKLHARHRWKCLYCRVVYFSNSIENMQYTCSGHPGWITEYNTYNEYMFPIEIYKNSKMISRETRRKNMIAHKINYDRHLSRPPCKDIDYKVL